MRRERASAVAVALLCAGVAGALYAPTLGYDFVNWDDWEYVTANPHLGALDAGFVRWCLTAYRVGNWHPATLFSYGVDHAFWELDPRGYHLTNLLLYALDAALAAWLAWRLLAWRIAAAPARLAGAALVGLLFATHPLHVESVAWISERKDVLYGAFWLASLIAWLAYARPEASPGRRRAAYAAALACFAISATAKPMAVTLPLVLLVLDAYPLGRLVRGRAWLRVALVEKLPFYAISAATTAVTLAAQVDSRAIAHSGLPLGARLWVAVEALALYLAKWLAPLSLVPLYPLPPASAIPGASHGVALLVVAALAVAAVALVRRLPVLAAALACYAVTLLPVLGLVEFGHHAAADRYAFLALLGPSLLAGAAAARAWQRGGGARALALLTALVWVAGLAWRTQLQLPVWRDSVSLWSRVVAAYPDATVARYNLGHAYAMAGDGARAEAEWRATLALDPVHTAALYELGVAAGRAGAYATARDYLERLIAEDPGHALGRINLAMVLDELGEGAAAAQHYRAFLRDPPPGFERYVEHAQLRLAALSAGPAAPAQK